LTNFLESFRDNTKRRADSLQQLGYYVKYKKICTSYHSYRCGLLFAIAVYYTQCLLLAVPPLNDTATRPLDQAIFTSVHNVSHTTICQSHPKRKPPNFWQYLSQILTILKICLRFEKVIAKSLVASFFGTWCIYNVHDTVHCCILSWFRRKHNCCCCC